MTAPPWFWKPRPSGPRRLRTIQRLAVDLDQIAEDLVRRVGMMLHEDSLEPDQRRVPRQLDDETVDGIRRSLVTWSPAPSTWRTRSRTASSTAR